MKEFLMLFRNDGTPPESSPEEMQCIVKDWNDWIGNIAAQGKFIASNALGYEGKIINAQGVVTDGPFTEVKEIVGGFLLLKANSLDEVIKLSEGCPIFKHGGRVEARPIMVFDE